MPALAKSNVGSSWGTHGDDFQYVWPLRLKYSMKVDRTLFAGHSSSFLSSPVDDMMEEEISIATTIVEGSSKSVYIQQLITCGVVQIKTIAKII